MHRIEQAHHNNTNIEKFGQKEIKYLNRFDGSLMFG